MSQDWGRKTDFKQHQSSKDVFCPQSCAAAQPRKKCHKVKCFSRGSGLWTELRGKKKNLLWGSLKDLVALQKYFDKQSYGDYCQLSAEGWCWGRIGRSCFLHLRRKYWLHTHAPSSEGFQAGKLLKFPFSVIFRSQWLWEGAVPCPWTSAQWDGQALKIQLGCPQQPCTLQDDVKINQSGT